MSLSLTFVAEPCDAMLMTENVRYSFVLQNLSYSLMCC